MEKRLPLEGVIVADFCWALAGPAFTKKLGEHGATVIRIESTTRICTNRKLGPYKDGIPDVDRAYFFTYTNNDKLGITLNLKHPKGMELVRKLIAKADVVTENFTAGTMKRLGLDYEKLVKINPSIIMMSLCMQGQTGPHAQYAGYGWLLQGISGLQSLTGFPGEPPLNPGAQLCDYIGAASALMATMAALDYRKRTGKGQYIDLSQLEGATYLMAPLTLAYSANGVEAKAMANRHPSAAPHGVYRCLGDDRWCAISVFTDEEWQKLADIIGLDWTAEPKFATLSGRKQNEDELEKLLEKWCANYTPEYLMTTLQAAGIGAGIVENAKDLFEDPQLKWRGHYQPLEHKVMGFHHYESPGYKLSDTPSQLRRAAPALGQDNEYVMKHILGLSDTEYAGLVKEGVFK